MQPDSIVCRSISSIEAVDFEYGNQVGFTIRQISWAELKDNRLFASVQPALVGLSSPLARVEGGQNLVMATGKFGGETMREREKNNAGFARDLFGIGIGKLERVRGFVMSEGRKNFGHRFPG